MVTRVMVAHTNYVGPLEYQCEDFVWQNFGRKGLFVGINNVVGGLSMEYS
jgi:hypothetical protein